MFGPRSSMLSLLPLLVLASMDCATARYEKDFQFNYVAGSGAQQIKLDVVRSLAGYSTGLLGTLLSFVLVISYITQGDKASPKKDRRELEAEMAVAPGSVFLSRKAPYIAGGNAGCGQRFQGYPSMYEV